jgi:hypothetical protein
LIVGRVAAAVGGDMHVSRRYAAQYPSVLAEEGGDIEPKTTPGAGVAPLANRCICCGSVHEADDEVGWPGENDDPERDLGAHTVGQVAR